MLTYIMGWDHAFQQIDIRPGYAVQYTRVRTPDPNARVIKVDSH
jgi:hypothetical protein